MVLKGKSHPKKKRERNEGKSTAWFYGKFSTLAFINQEGII